MNTIIKLIISLAAGAGGAALAGALLDVGQNPLLYLLFVASTVATALLLSLPGLTFQGDADAGDAARGALRRADEGTDTAAGDGREQGTVKWFNANKGFGFIIRDNGEEIFVHFRSIRGSGRRGLQDGQRVSYRVAETEKGPQAEDVESLA